MEAVSKIYLKKVKVKRDVGSQPSMKVVHQVTIMWSAASKFYLLIMQTHQK